MNLLLATENQNKLREVREILGDSVKVFSLRDLAPNLSLPEEGVESFEENASQKAIYIASETKLLTLADDSGFEVEALSGQPGVISARFAGTQDSAQQRKEILRLMANAKTRKAKFVCVLALYEPVQKKLSLFRGEVQGDVAPEERGEGGFGYDSIFIPDGYVQTFAELPPATKNQISHRARALKELKKQWQFDHEVPAESLQYLFDQKLAPKL